MIKKILIAYRNSVWFFPTIFLIGAVLAAIITARIDFEFQSYFYNHFPDYLITENVLARSVLSVIATSLLTMTAITFSTIMIVFSVYSSQFSHRTLQNFIADRLTQIVLGIFIAGFTYSIISLLLMRESGAKTVVFSTIIAILISLLCIGFFIRFIHFITKSIQVDNLIDDIKEEVFKTNKKKIEELEGLEDNGISISSSPKEINFDSYEKFDIFPEISGHIQFFDVKAMIEFAESENILIIIQKKIGDFVTESTNLFTIITFSKIEESTEFKSEISKMVSIGNYRDSNQDIDYSISKLEEVALRAISKGINDPNTAIICIRNLGNIISKVADNYRGKLYFYNNKKVLRMLMESKDFKDLIYSSFCKILNYSREQISILSSILDAIIIIAECGNDKLKETLIEFTDYVISGFNIDTLQDIDRNYLSRKLNKISRLLT